MLRFGLSSVVAIVLAVGGTTMVSAGEGRCGCRHCSAPDGCCWQEVVTHRCVLVPERKPIKKTVYECKEVPYCEHALPKFGHCDCCPSCKACPKYKKVLLKKEIVVGEICTTKCVVEEVVERVLGPCCHCGQANACDEEPTDAPAVPTPGKEVAPPTPPQSAFAPPAPVVIGRG